MGAPNLDPGSVQLVSSLVAGYIEEQRDRYKSRATALSHEQKAPLRGFFRDSLLDLARTEVLINERLSNPDFFSTARSFGISNLPDFSSVEAVTFENVVVAHAPFSDGLLFHELVHVEQYRQLGVTKFAELYVRHAPAAHRFAYAGLLLMGLALTGVTVIIFGAVAGPPTGAIAGACAIVAQLALWVVLPLWVRRGAPPPAP